MVKFLVEHCQANVETTDKEGKTALHYASSCGGLDTIKYLVEQCSANVGATSKDGETMLHVASKIGFLDVVQYLVEHGQANVEATDKDGKTALHYACAYAGLDITQYLAAQCPDNAKAQSTMRHCLATVKVPKMYGMLYGQPVLSLVSHLDTVKYLVEHGKANVDAADMYGKMAFDYASAYNGLTMAEYNDPCRMALVEPALSNEANKSDIVLNEP